MSQDCRPFVPFPHSYMRQMDLYDAYLQFRGGAYKSANDTDNLQFLAAETDFLELLKQGV